MAQSSLPNKSTSGGSNQAPAVALVTSSTTQVPLFIDHSISPSVGEEMLHYVHMRDGSWAYIKQSLLMSATGTIKV